MYFSFKIILSPIQKGIVLLGNLRGQHVRVWVLRKVARVSRLADCWQVGSRNLLLGQLVPVDRFVPTMVLDVVRAVLEASIALGNVRDKQMFDDTLGVLVEISRELDFALQDLLVNRHGVVVVEGIDTSNHFISQNSERPPVHRLAVTFVQQDLWSQVFGSATQGVGASLAVLSEAKIGEFEVAFLVNEDVFGLQVTVNDVLAVHVFEHEEHL